MDCDTITLSAARRKFSRVDPIRTAHEDGTRANLFRVPLAELTNEARQGRENAEARARSLRDHLQRSDTWEAYVGIAQLGSEKATLERTVAAQQTAIVTQRNEIASLRRENATQRNALQTQIDDLKSFVTSQLGDQRKEIESLKSTIKNLKSTIKNLKSKNENLESEIELLRGLSPLLG